MNTPSARRMPSYGLAAGLAFALLAIQIMVTMSGSPVFASRAGVLTQQFTELAVREPLTFWPLLLYMALAILSHLTLMMGAAWLWRGACRAVCPPLIGRLLHLSGFLALVTLLAVLWNLRLFPLSTAFAGADVLLMQPASPLLLWGGSAVLACVAAIGLANRFRRHSRAWSVAAAAVAVLVLLPGWTLAPSSPAATSESRPANHRPNIILLGVDSLRPDFLFEYGYPDQRLTPTINALSRDMVLFEDAVTPMARTFVSYMSLLTGQYPTRHGARFNLFPRDLFDRSQTIAHRLRKAGYITAYSTDETRFANFDRSFGFDMLAMPPASVNDFIVNAVLDTVATNLVVATPLGRVAAPHLTGNRAAYRLYDPNDHAERVDDLINRLPGDRPVLLVTHYCLPHWPYVHQTLPYAMADVKPTRNNDWQDAPGDYLRALRAVDRQIQQNLKKLRESGYLDNAVVVLYSDHGEGLRMERERIEGLGSNVESELVTSGHGTRVLGDVQHRVVLGLQHYVKGRPQWQASKVSAPASLIDLPPTLLTVVGLSYSPAEFDGLNLRPHQSGEKNAHISPERMRFIETGLTSAVVEAAKIDEDAVAREFSQLYSLQDDLRLEIDPAKLPAQMTAKQRGVYWKQYGLATVRGFTREEDCWVLADFDRRTMRCVPDPLQDAVAGPMAQAVCHHYGADPGFRARWCHSSNGLHNRSIAKPAKRTLEGTRSLPGAGRRVSTRTVAQARLTSGGLR